MALKVYKRIDELKETYSYFERIHPSRPYTPQLTNLTRVIGAYRCIGQSSWRFMTKWLHIGRAGSSHMAVSVDAGSNPGSWRKSMEQRSRDCGLSRRGFSLGNEGAIELVTQNIRTVYKRICICIPTIDSQFTLDRRSTRVCWKYPQGDESVMRFHARQSFA